MTNLAVRLSAVVAPQHVLEDPQLMASFETDWTGRFSGRARLVVRPGSTQEVAEVLRICNEEVLAIVPQGGNTGLVGGSIPRDGAVLLSLTRLKQIGEIDAISGQVTADAGVTLAAVQAKARAAGLDFGVDIAARDSATIGGMVATNAGGLRVLRYGHMRAQVVGLEAVLADGSVVSRLSGLTKDNSGYDLAGLLVGSEGTLAVVTAIRLRLVPLLGACVTALLGLSDLAAALRLVAAVRRDVSSLDSIEVFFQPGLDLVCEHGRIEPPFRQAYGCYLLIECAGRRDPLDELAAALSESLDIADSAVATDKPGRDRLWSYRELHTSAINAAGIPHKLDVSLPLGQLEAFAERVPAAVAEAVAGARTILFGHLADGNLHVNVLGPEPDDERVAEVVFSLVAEHEGSISAEHGIGVAKVPWLSLTRSQADLAAMQAIKRALDPRGILNPGVIFPTPA
ncbi:MAG: FAD-binding oxidoreductase [Dehalococcoidia bacterium]